MKGLSEYINESIQETSKYKKAQFDKDFKAYEGIVYNNAKLKNCLKKLDAESMMDDEDFITVAKHFSAYLDSSRYQAEEDDEETLTYEEVVERAPQWLMDNLGDKYDVDEEALPMYVSYAVDIWNSIAKHKIA